MDIYYAYNKYIFNLELQNHRIRYFIYSMMLNFKSTKMLNSIFLPRYAHNLNGDKIKVVPNSVISKYYVKTEVIFKLNYNLRVV